MVTILDNQSFCQKDDNLIARFCAKAIEQHESDNFENILETSYKSHSKKLSFRKRFLICPECKYVAEKSSRFEAHFNEPRHVNNYRNLAYKYPKKRQIWLKIWFDKLEAAELINSNYFEVMEEDGEDEDDFNDMFNPRKLSTSSSTISNWSQCSASSDEN